MTQYIIAVSVMILLYHSLSISVGRYEGVDFKYVPFRLKVYTIFWYAYTLIIPYVTGGSLGTLATWFMLGYVIYENNKKKDS